MISKRPASRSKSGRSAARAPLTRDAMVSRLAKITRPLCVDVYPRNRVFEALDSARRRPIVWVAAPAGSGKTTLVASYAQARKTSVLWYRIDSGDRDLASFFYHLGQAAAVPSGGARLPMLTPDYRSDLEAYAGNYFRELFAHMRTSSLLVFDDYHELPADADLHRIVQLGFDQIPSGVNMIVTSRASPPAQFVRERACERMSLLAWEDLRLTREESAALVAKRIGSQAREHADALYRQTQGWVAGLVLLTESSHAPVDDRTFQIETASQSIFDYFASEVFQQSDADVQDFLLRTAFLPKFSVALAQTLTASERAPEILAYLLRRNLFTTQHADGSVEYHSLFRSFLEVRARERLDRNEVQRLKRNGAQLLAAAGDTDGALLLLCKLEDWVAVSKLAQSKADEWVSQGRTETLARWLGAIPGTVRDGDPWALYWLGVCKLASAARDARTLFERAFDIFEREHDATPVYLTWSRIVESFVLEWNDFTPLREWLDRYPSLSRDRHPPSADAEAASVFAYVSGLFYGRPDSTDLPEYCSRAEQLCRREQDPDRLFAQAVVLMPYYLWRGDWSKMDGVLQMLAPHVSGHSARPLAKLYYYVWRSFHASNSGLPNIAMNAIADGLALGQREGIHLLDLRMLAHGVWGELCVGNLTAANEFFMKITPPPPGQAGAHYNFFYSLVLLHQGDLAAASKRAQSCLQQAKENSLFYSEAVYRIGAAYVSFQVAQAGNPEATVRGDSLRIVEEVRTLGQRARSNLIVYMSEFCEAHIRIASEQRELGLRALRHALKLGKNIGIVTPPWCLRAHAAHLYALALEEDIERDHVIQVISRTRLLPPRDLVSEHWPWPIRIRTLGGFAVLKDGMALSFSGRMQTKPLDLLRVLVALGARNVSIDKIAQVFWPYRSRTVARTAVETTLHRLRKLIGDKSVVVQAGELSLNQELCWLDVWALRSLIDVQSGIPASARANRALQLYRGPFLVADDASWAAVERERTRSQFLRGVAQIGNELETEGRCLEAASLYQRGIEADPLAEQLYRSLMRCLRDLDRPAEALSAYQRCRTTLRAFGVEPSGETRALFTEIQSTLS